KNADHLRGGLSQIFTMLVSLLFGIDTDMQSGMKIFRRYIYDRQKIHTGQWSLDLYLVTYAVFNGHRLKNVPIDYQERHGGESKVVPFKVAVDLLHAAIQLKAAWIFQRVMKKMFNRENSLNKSSHQGTVEQAHSLDVGRGSNISKRLTAEDREKVID